jgi:hypothetical protein
MAKLTYEKSIALAVLFTACSLASVCLLAAPQDQGTRQNDFSHVVQIKKTYVRGGDMITIDEVRGPSKERVVASLDRKRLGARTLIKGENLRPRRFR